MQVNAGYLGQEGHQVHWNHAGYLGHVGHSVRIGFMQIMKGIHDLKVMGSSSSYVILITVFSSTGWIHEPSCAFEYL